MNTKYEIHQNQASLRTWEYIIYE